MRRFLAVLRRFWNVAGALVGVGSLPPITKILGLIWRRIADIDTAADLWVKAGGSIPRLLGYIESPYFGPALIVIGFLWALLRWRAEELLGSERAITVTDRIGWTFVAGALIAILSTMLFNEFLVEAKAPQFAQSIVDQQSDRGMHVSEFDKIVATFAPVAAELPDIQVQAVSASPNAPGYAVIFMTALHAAGMTVNGVKAEDTTSMLYPGQATVSSMQMKGLLIGVKNVTAPPDNAVRFRSLLKTAGFDSKFANWQGVGENNYVLVVSYR